MTAADNTAGELDTATGLYGLDADEYPYLVICSGCNGTGQAYMGRFSPRPSTCRECLGLGEVECDQ